MADFTNNNKPIDYNQEVAAGRVPGVANRTVIAESSNIGLISSEIWGGALSFSFNYSGIGEQWEVVSSDAEDNPSGSGASEITVFYVDDNFERQQFIVILDGLTPVVIPNSDKLFPIHMQVTAVQAGGNPAGNIIMQIAGGGTPRGFIKIGKNVSEDGLSLVPAGETWFFDDWVRSTGKGEDVLFKMQFTTGQDGIWLDTPNLDGFQETTTAKAAKLVIQEKSFIRILATSSNTNTRALASLRFISEQNA